MKAIGTRARAALIVLAGGLIDATGVDAASKVIRNTGKYLCDREGSKPGRAT